MSRFKLEELKRRVLERIKPSREDEEFLRSKAEEIVTTLQRILNELHYDADVKVLGSFAKGTRLKGKKELDVFILVPPPEGITRKNYKPLFEELVSNLIKRLPRKYELRYANHPYVRIHLGDVSADVVPAFDVEDPSNIISPVDRSPHHAKFVIEHTDEKLRDEIRLLKQFLKGLRVYGAEIKVQGLPGYACELLVISEGSFEKALEAIRRLKFIDPARHYDFHEDFGKALQKGLMRLLENSVMVIVDPVDPKRNVAAALSWRTYAKLRMGIELFFESPHEAFFFTPEPPERTPEDKDLVLYGKISDESEDVLRGRLRRNVRIVEKYVHGDENLRYHVLEISPGTHGEYRYIHVRFSGYSYDRGRIRGPRVTGRTIRFLKRFEDVRLEGPIEVNDPAKEFIRPKKRLADEILSKPLGVIRREIRQGRENVAREFHLEAFASLKYPDPREALRNMLKGSLPMKPDGVRPLDGKPLPVKVHAGFLRPIPRIANQIVSGSS